MPDNDIEMGQPAAERKTESNAVDMADPESFYRINESKEEREAPNKESSREEQLKRPVIPPRSQKPRTRRSTDDLDSKQPDNDYRSLKKDYEDVRHDLRIAWRENKEQATELRDLKKQNAHLKETMRTQGDSKSFKDQIMSERRRFYEHVDMLDDHIAHLKHQLEKTKLHMDQLTFQTREANEEKATYESRLQTLQKQNARLNEDLTECRDDILRLQPPSQIPDSKIAEEYANLHQQIASWVDDEAEDSQAMETQLANLLADKDAPELLKSILDNDIIKATRKYPEAEPLILRYVIQMHIHRTILADDIYLFGLDEHNETILRSIAHAMEDLEPKRDTLTIQRWRSETLQALAKIDGFQAEQHRQATLVSKSLYSALAYLLPELSTSSSSSSGEGGWKRLHETVTMPAVHLATNMRFSTSVYRIITHLPRSAHHGGSGGSGSNPGVIFHNDISRYTIIDIATQKVLRQDSILKIGEEGRIGEAVFLVQPLLLRMQKVSTGVSEARPSEGRAGGGMGGANEGRSGGAGGGSGSGGGGGSGIALCKPAVAVKLDEPMAKRSKGVGKLVGQWAGSWFGGEIGGGGGGEGARS